MVAGWWAAWFVAVAVGAGPDREPAGLTVTIPLNEAAEIDVVALVREVGAKVGVSVDHLPTGAVRLPMAGLSAPLTQTLLRETLGPDVRLDVADHALSVHLPPDRARDEWAWRLSTLARRADQVIQKRSRFGFRARPSYRPNDPTRPTVCLIHGLNSTSNVFTHFYRPLEDAGLGVVTYDFPYNRDLDETSAVFGRDWATFRQSQGDKAPWAIVAHSMGSLLARAYVEDDAAYRGDVSAMVLIAPPNQGSALAQGQTLLQMAEGLQAVQGTRRSDPLALLGDGVGAAADDMMPGSAYLNRLNARPRRAGVRTVVLAGDHGYLSAGTRREVEARLGGGSGLLGGLGRLAIAGTVEALDAITDGKGDGCVSVRSTRLDGADPPRVYHLNHLELIRAPLLYAEPGPVPTMPAILDAVRPWR